MDIVLAMVLFPYSKLVEVVGDVIRRGGVSVLAGINLVGGSSASVCGGVGGTVVRGFEDSDLALHIEPIIADAEVVGLKPLEAAGGNVPHLPAYLAHGPGSTSRTRGHGWAASRLLGTAITRRRRIAAASTRDLSRRVVGEVDIGTEFGTPVLDTLLRVQ